MFAEGAFGTQDRAQHLALGRRKVQSLDSGKHTSEEIAFTADAIARYRVSPEAQEVISAFFEKRKPRWNEED